MHPRTPLPAELVERPFRVEEALALGVTAKRLRSDDVWAPFWGVRVAVSLGWGPELRARCGLLVCPERTAVVGRSGIDVEVAPLALGVPRVDGGVLRPADADLWARLVRLPPRIRGDDAVLSGRAVLTRCDGQVEVLEAALVRHGPHALAGARWLLDRVRSGERGAAA